jgi:hypothetical protein
MEHCYQNACALLCAFVKVFLDAIMRDARFGLWLLLIEECADKKNWGSAPTQFPLKNPSTGCLLVTCRWVDPN